MTISTSLFTESAPTMTCICSGIATIPSQQNTVWLTRCLTRPEISVPAPSAPAEKRRTPEKRPGKMQVPFVGSQQDKIEDHSPKNSGQKGTNTCASFTSNNQRPCIVVS